MVQRIFGAWPLAVTFFYLLAYFVLWFVNALDTHVVRGLGLFCVGVAVLAIWSRMSSLVGGRRQPWQIFLFGLVGDFAGRLCQGIPSEWGWDAAILADGCFLLPAGLSFAALCTYLRQGRMANTRTWADTSLFMLFPIMLLFHYASGTTPLFLRSVSYIC